MDLVPMRLLLVVVPLSIHAWWRDRCRPILQSPRGVFHRCHERGLVTAESCLLLCGACTHGIAAQDSGEHCLSMYSLPV